jgi:hypothetical protein
MYMSRLLSILILSMLISSCGLFDTFYVSPKSTPYLTQQVKPSYRNTNTIGDVYLSFLSTSEALDICNSKLISIRELQNKNQDM